ncbi:MAG: hypothetical protein HYZ17_05460 [Betaproteobacteria bacterium]|nr:hypothetical protein [Betaproteobacteria bacterium]
MNQSKVQEALNAYQAKLKEAIDAQKPNATVGDVLGIIAADPDKLPYLSGSSPYTIKTVATRMSDLPDSLRHHFRYRLFLDDFAYRSDSAVLDYQAPTAALAGKKITLAWVAATEEDQQAIEALLPKPHPDGTPIQPEELPQGLPASIRLKLEIRVNGETKATGPALTAGSEPIGAGAFTNYFDLTTWDETTDLLVAGQQSALPPPQEPRRPRACALRLCRRGNWRGRPSPRRQGPRQHHRPGGALPCPAGQRRSNATRTGFLALLSYANVTPHVKLAW